MSPGLELPSRMNSDVVASNPLHIYLPSLELLRLRAAGSAHDQYSEVIQGFMTVEQRLREAGAWRAGGQRHSSD